MAHQAHNIPWTLVSTNLVWRPANKCKDGAADLHWRSLPGQAKELTFFATAFARTLAEHADCERKKFPETYEQPQPGSVVLNDESCRKIIPTVRHFRSQLRFADYPYDQASRSATCTHRHNGEKVFEGDDSCGRRFCGCPLPWELRLYDAFLIPREDNDCYAFSRTNQSAFLNLEISKSLLLHGEMDTLIHVYSHPGHFLPDWWRAYPCECAYTSLGWKVLCDSALDVYLLLNIIYCIPELWERGREEHKDYRNTRAYQVTVMEATKTDRYTNVGAFPHRQFFGIPDKEFYSFWRDLRPKKAKDEPSVSSVYPAGCVTYHQLLQLAGLDVFLPTVSGVRQVRAMLRSKDLPDEIAETVLDYAGYGTQARRLEVEHDPFHPENRRAFHEYIKYCWVLLIRFEVIARVAGLKIEWEDMVAESLVRMFSCGNGGKNHASYKHVDIGRNESHTSFV